MVILIVLSVSVVLSLAGLAAGGSGLHLVSTVLLLVTVMALVDRARSLWSFGGIPRRYKQWVGPLLIVGTLSVLYFRLLIGDMPVNHDHPVFLYRAFNTGKLIWSGSLTGFSQFLFAGYPANSLYPMGVDLLVCAVHAMGLGLISWEYAYCIALFLFILSTPLALYALGKRFSGSLAGVTAALLYILDRGAWLQGGWSFNLDWGVWSMGLSFSLSLWTLWALDRLVRKPGLGRFLMTAGFFAGAVLCHPMALAIMGVVLPLFLLVMAWRGDLDAPGIWIPRVVGAFFLGLCLTAFWLLPFISHKDWFEPLAYQWLSFPLVIRGALDGSLLSDFSPLLLLGGFLGLLLGARRGSFFAWFLLVANGIILFFASNTFLLSFDVLEKFPSLSNLQLERYTYFVRASLLLGCGLLLVEIKRAGTELSENATWARSTFARHGLRTLFALAVAPMILFIPQAGPLPYLVPSKRLTWSSKSELYHDMRLAADFIKHQDPSTIGRIAVRSSKHHHLLIALPVYTGKPIFKLGFTPENNYRYKFDSDDPMVWQALNVSHLLSIGPYDKPGLTEIRRFGHLFLYSFSGFSRSRVSLAGPGSAQVERDEAEAMDVRLQGTGPGSRLTIYTGRYALWSAEMNGIEIPIEGSSLADSPPVFMQVAVHDGLLRLRYRRGFWEWSGSILSLISLLTFVFMIVLFFTTRVRKRVGLFFSTWRTLICDATTLFVLASSIAVVTIVTIRLLLPSAYNFPGRHVVAALEQLMSQASAKVIHPTGSKDCRPFDGQKIRCPGPEWNYAGKTIIVSDHLLRQCIWLHPIRGAKFALSFDDVPLGDHMQGQFGMDDAAVEPPGPGYVNMTVFLDDKELGHFTCPSRRGWFTWQVDTPRGRGKRGRITIQSDAPNTDQGHFCFTAYTTEDSKDRKGPFWDEN